MDTKQIFAYYFRDTITDEVVEIFAPDYDTALREMTMMGLDPKQYKSVIK